MGHIKCTLHHCYDRWCPGKGDNLKAGLINKHMVITAHYTNFFEHETYGEFLGYSISHAHNRLPHAKSHIELKMREFTLKWRGSIEQM